jgi:hypothetical protein
MDDDEDGSPSSNIMVSSGVILMLRFSFVETATPASSSFLFGSMLRLRSKSFGGSQDISSGLGDEGVDDAVPTPL